MLKDLCSVILMSKELHIVVFWSNITTFLNIINLSIIFDTSSVECIFFPLLSCFKRNFLFFPSLRHFYIYFVYIHYSLCHSSELLYKDNCEECHTYFHVSLVKKEVVICYISKCIRVKLHHIKAVEAKFLMSSITLCFLVFTTSGKEGI